jgi:DUF971 family protein
MTTPHSRIPENIVLHQNSNQLELIYAEGESQRVCVELMRLFSPSAEVQGHGPGQETLQTGKRGVRITALEPVGTYALQPTFSDGHDSGLFTWALLYDLAVNAERYWSRYQNMLLAAGRDRDDPMPQPSDGGCGS